MMRAGKILICLACGLALNAILHAKDMTPIERMNAVRHAKNKTLTDNPYISVVTRNVFGLNPSLPITQDVTPQKITPNGIMNIFGTRQVLFKVTRPGQPSKEQSYILSEGQRQDDIEVTHIDEQAGVVTFNNRGVIQEIPLTKSPDITTIAPAPAPPPVRTFSPVPNTSVDSGGGAVFGFGNRLNRNRSLNNNSSASGVNPRANNPFMNPSTSSATPQGLPPGMSAEDQAVLVTANHVDAVQRNDPSAVLYPPTQFDQEAGIVPTPPSP